jgi:hypothetical protein
LRNTKEGFVIMTREREFVREIILGEERFWFKENI